MRWLHNAAVSLVLAMTVAAPAGAQADGAPALQSFNDAIAQDAGTIAGQLALPPDEMARQLRLQDASAAVTDRIAARYAGRLAGISIEHVPAFRIVVLLKGTDPVPDEVVDIAGEQVEVTFVTGAAASHAELVQAISSYQAPIRASLIGPPGLGVDQRTGAIVALVAKSDVDREGAGALQARLAALTGVPVRVRMVEEPARNMAGMAGGMRVMGGVEGDARQFLCTAGFLVTDGSRSGIVTAAHCPDTLKTRDATGQVTVLPFEGQWGWGYQDVQVNLVTGISAPVFFADTAKSVSRPVTGARSRAGTRAGDVVCHRGERTGYSCSLVELTDFAPAGDLCGGACLPTWTTVAGPTCRAGDSGGPVFLGTTAYGIVKGGSYRRDGSCAFFFYMSTDYLPTGWALLTTPFGDTMSVSGIVTTGGR